MTEEERNVNFSMEKKIIFEDATFDREEGKQTNTTEHVQELLQLWRYYTKILYVNDPTVRNIAAELCALLLKTNSLEALSVFLKELPTDVVEYTENESILRAKVHVALNKKDTKTVKSLLKEHNFSNNGEDLIRIWDDAHYLEEEIRTGKKLTALSRFRVRKRHPPPRTICNDGIRKTSTLPREATSYLKTWLLNHIYDPYPSAMEKQQLAKISGLSQAQVKTWFANARRRSKNTDEFRKRCEDTIPNMTSQPLRESSSTRKVNISSPPPPPPPPLSFSSIYHDNTENQAYHYIHFGGEANLSDPYHDTSQTFHNYHHQYPLCYDRMSRDRSEVVHYPLSMPGYVSNTRCPSEQMMCQYDVPAKAVTDLSTKHHHDFYHAGQYFYG